MKIAGELASLYVLGCTITSVPNCQIEGRGVGSQNWVKCDSRCYWMSPNIKNIQVQCLDQLPMINV